MTHAKLTKLHTKPGRDNPNGINNGYTVKGYYVNEPTVGKPFTIVRYERNGIKVTGIMHTSMIVRVVKQKNGFLFGTLNSGYKLVHLLPHGKNDRKKYAT